MRSLMYLESVLAIGAVDELLPVCTMPLGELLDHFEPDGVVDARMRKRATIDDQRSLAPTVVGLGPGLDINRNCHIGIETAWGDRLGQGVRSGMTAPLRGEPRPLAGIGRERFIYAPNEGHWHTRRGIGDKVVKGQLIGHIDGQAVAAPIRGVLRGLSHDGVAVASNQKIIEVDPREPSARLHAHERALQDGPLRPEAVAFAMARSAYRRPPYPTGRDVRVAN
jgi:hypothetical protein